jgi:outer membrane protein insertion porin family
LDKDSIRKTENLIKQIYISKGYNNANIVSITENISVDRVNVIFQINEGGLSYLSKIKFIGNSSLSNSYLTNLINSKDRGLLSFLSNKGYYDQNLINFDKEILISNYREKGFFDVKIQTLVVESVFNSYILEFYINEGKRYKIDEIIYNLDDEIISDELYRNTK